jgi:hypothetical protein
MRPNNMFRDGAVLTLAALTALAAAACGGKDMQQAASAPPREIQLAPTPPVQPQLNDAPVKTASAPRQAPTVKKEEPTPVPPILHVQVSPIAPQGVPVSSAPTSVPAVAGAAVTSAGPAPTPLGTVDAGTSFVVRTSVRICTNSHKVGDRFSTVLATTVQGSNGAVIPTGSPVVFRIVEASRPQSSPDSLHLVFEAVSVRVGDDAYQLEGLVTQTSPLEKVRVQSTTDQAKKVGAGAAVGAIIGQLIGKNTKSTVVGAAVGAAAGGAVAAGTTTYDGCVPQLTPITVTLNRPLTMRVAGTRASP